MRNALFLIARAAGRCRRSSSPANCIWPVRAVTDGYVGSGKSPTADRFGRRPFVSGESGCTGPAIWFAENADGDLDYLGRTDFQVKIRGQRVELGEIEANLRREGRVDSAVVVVRTDLGAPTLVACAAQIRGPLLTRICRRRCCAGAVGTCLATWCLRWSSCWTSWSIHPNARPVRCRIRCSPPTTLGTVRGV